MSKAVTKGAHWLPRHSQYSLHGRRNGRVDVLPAGAAEQLYDIAAQIGDGNERIVIIRAERERLSAELHSLNRQDGLRLRYVTDPKLAFPDARLQLIKQRLSVLDSDMRRERKQINELKALYSESLTFEATFVKIAKAELAPSTYKTLADKAMRIVVRAKK
jgi:hypothetical protein